MQGLHALHSCPGGAPNIVPPNAVALMISVYEFWTALACQAPDGDVYIWLCNGT